MRRAIAVILSLTLSGCAAHRRPSAPGAGPLHGWASLAAIPRGTPVRVTLHYDIDGGLDEVTDSSLTIRVPPDMHRVTMSGVQVIRVAVLSPKRMPFRWLGKPLGLVVLGGLIGVIVGSVMWDAEVVGKSFSVFTASVTIWFCHFSYHRVDHEWRVVYARP